MKPEKNTTSSLRPSYLLEKQSPTGIQKPTGIRLFPGKPKALASSPSLANPLVRLNKDLRKIEDQELYEIVLLETSTFEKALQAAVAIKNKDLRKKGYWQLIQLYKTTQIRPSPNPYYKEYIANVKKYIKSSQADAMFAYYALADFLEDKEEIAFIDAIDNHALSQAVRTKYASLPGYSCVARLMVAKPLEDRETKNKVLASIAIAMKDEVEYTEDKYNETVFIAHLYCISLIDNKDLRRNTYKQCIGCMVEVEKYFKSDGKDKGPLEDLKDAESMTSQEIEDAYEKLFIDHDIDSINTHPLWQTKFSYSTSFVCACLLNYNLGSFHKTLIQKYIKVYGADISKKIDVIKCLLTAYSENTKECPEEYAKLNVEQITKKCLRILQDEWTPPAEAINIIKDIQVSPEIFLKIMQAIILTFQGKDDAITAIIASHKIATQLLNEIPGVHLELVRGTSARPQQTLKEVRFALLELLLIASYINSPWFGKTYEKRKKDIMSILEKSKQNKINQLKLLQQNLAHKTEECQLDEERAGFYLDHYLTLNNNLKSILLGTEVEAKFKRTKLAVREG